MEILGHYELQCTFLDMMGLLAVREHIQACSSCVLLDVTLICHFLSLV